jgi:hypothetical protein
MHGPACDLQDEHHIDPSERHHALHREEVHATIANACARRNCHQVVPVYRTDAGNIRNHPRATADR